MILYLSGISTAWFIIDFLSRKPDVLTSYIEKWKPDPQKVNRVFLDSGAFTAFTSGKPIDLRSYINYCHRHKRDFDVIAALDVIGDWKASKQNYIDMQKEDLDVLPTYHVGEPLEFLDWLFERYKYVAIGGLVPYIGMTTKQTYNTALMRLLTYAHKKALDADVKLHGFGVTGWDLMSKLPWYSVDSTSYLAGQKFARPIYMANGKLKGDRDYYKAAKYARSIGLQMSASDIIPGRKGGNMKERYHNILLLNIETMFRATDLITRRNQCKQQSR